MIRMIALVGAFLAFALTSSQTVAARTYYHFYPHRHVRVLANRVPMIVIRRHVRIVVPYRAPVLRHRSYRHHYTVHIRYRRHAEALPFGRHPDGGTVWGGSSALAMARAEVGTNPTGWGHNWCAHYLNRVLAATGHAVSGSDMAASFRSYGYRLTSPVIGAIAWNYHHVGMVNAVEGNEVQLVSGNTGHRGRYGRAVGYTWYPRWAYSYVALR